MANITKVLYPIDALIKTKHRITYHQRLGSTTSRGVTIFALLASQVSDRKICRSDSDV